MVPIRRFRITQSIPTFTAEAMEVASAIPPCFRGNIRATLKTALTIRATIAAFMGERVSWRE